MLKGIAQRQMIRIPADDGWPLRVERWRHPDPQATILLLNGRGDFVEKYVETAEELAAAGFDIIAMDWRGQGLSGDMTPPPRVTHIDDYDLWVRDAVAVVAACNVQTPLHVVAHSMGAHLAIRLLHDHGALFTRAVLLAPMLGIRTAPLAPAMARVMAESAVRFGRGRQALWGQGLPNREPLWIRMNRLTSDAARFAQEQDAMTANPALRIGGISFGWLAATFRSLDLMVQQDYAAAIPTPSLMFLASREILTDNDAARRFSGWMPSCKLIELADARHEVARERDAIRAPLMRRMIDFLKGT